MPYHYPERSLYKLTESHWFPKSKDAYESRLDDLEREEEEWTAKVDGISGIQASMPIGASAEVMSRYEKKQLDAKNNQEEKAGVAVKFWNRPRRQVPEQQTFSLNSTPTTRAASNQQETSSETSFAYGIDTPMSRRSLSINLDNTESGEESLDLGTPTSPLTGAAAPLSSCGQQRIH